MNAVELNSFPAKRGNVPAQPLTLVLLMPLTAHPGMQGEAGKTRGRLLVADHSKWTLSSYCKVASFKYVDRLYTDITPNQQRKGLPDSVSIIEC
ncbi:MAG: hypothetical protein ACJARU_002031, partial [Congregibacter sp.]